MNDKELEARLIDLCKESLINNLLVATNKLSLEAELRITKRIENFLIGWGNGVRQNIKKQQKNVPTH